MCQIHLAKYGSEPNEVGMAAAIEEQNSAQFLQLIGRGFDSNDDFDPVTFTDAFVSDTTVERFFNSSHSTAFTMGGPPTSTNDFSETLVRSSMSTIFLEVTHPSALSEMKSISFDLGISSTDDSEVLESVSSSSSDNNE